MTKKKILLFQPYLRKHILNFGKSLKRSEFVLEIPSKSQKSFYKSLPTFEYEINRIKTGWQCQARRIFGIPNIRIKIDRKADVLFTYGCLLFTNKPYCVYIENGVALFNYDLVITRHLITRLLFSILVRMPQCRTLIFMSQAGEKSFFSTVPLSERTRAIVRKKSIQIYPLIEQETKTTKNLSPKKPLRLLFAGMFYIKGGMELCHAFEILKKTYNHLELTIIAPLQTIKESDRQYIINLPGLTLLDATLDEVSMKKMYASHDIFMLPTFRDGFGLVLVEAIAHGMPLICTDQYATTEVVSHKYNGFVFPNHPLKDYDPQTYELLGKYYNPKDFYKDLFRFQVSGALKPVESFIVSSVQQYLDTPSMLKEHSLHSLALYAKRFDAKKISAQIESVFFNAMEK